MKQRIDVRVQCERRNKNRGGIALLLVGMIVPLLASAPAALATWSIVAADAATQEVAIGSATCVTGLDLRAISPAMAVGLGGGAAQSFQDTSGVRRQTIFNGLQAGESSDQIMQSLIALSGSANHQNGVADTGSDSATFSGSNTGAHSSGLVGNIGTLHYAIQGNLLTGRPVVTEAERAFVETAGDLPEKLMAAMEAARAFGGDGRCSCPGSVTGCGSPPPSFTKSAHIGFMIVSRFGDTDGSNCDANGCARGDYFMNFNVPFQSSGDLDPVFQLQNQFDAWRQTLIGRPDAIATTAEFLPTGDDDFTLRITLIDWRDVALGSSINSVAVEHAPGSAAITSIGAVNDLGTGVYEVPLTRGLGSGIDRFLVTLDDGIRLVVLPPRTVELDLTGAICGNGVCDSGEDCLSCASDCPSFTSSGATCGNGICEAGDGEDCLNCAADCNGRQGGKPSNRFCCGNGDCSSSECNSGGFSCTTDPAMPGSTCCGDLLCQSPEDASNCAIDCAFCQATEVNEQTCGDGVDNDCDGLVDCADLDCSSDPSCSGCNLGQLGDPCTADADCCSNKCKGPTGGKTCK